MTEVAADTHRSGTYIYRRHTLALRIMHWINALTFFVLLASGLQIFNAHPALYWGRSSYTGEGPFLEMTARYDANGNLQGVTRIGELEIGTTGLFGASENSNGVMAARGFPAWATLPSDQWLAMGRRWHFFFAWLFTINAACYAIYSIGTRHLQRDLTPTRGDWRSFWRVVKEHLRLKHARGEAARRYNVLQRLTYLVVMFVLLPFVLLMGLAMSPWLDSVVPGWVDVVGGRQSARTLHFIAAMLLVLFLLVHVFEVIVSGVWNNMRSMITGRYRIESERGNRTTELDGERHAPH